MSSAVVPADANASVEVSRSMEEHNTSSGFQHDGIRKGNPSVQNPKTSLASTNRRVHYAVVGLGHIAQVAVLPAFAHAKGNSELRALVSGDPAKLAELRKRYYVPRTYSYKQYEECVRGGEVDAVYIALPNSMHCHYSVAAAQAGIHILCEKPMAVCESDCDRMINVVVTPAGLAGAAACGLENSNLNSALG